MNSKNQGSKNIFDFSLDDDLKQEIEIEGDLSDDEEKIKQKQDGEQLSRRKQLSFDDKTKKEIKTNLTKSLGYIYSPKYAKICSLLPSNIERVKKRIKTTNISK